MSQPPAIEIRDLYFAYNGEQVLSGVNLTVAPRDFAAVVGPNGGGKTTLLKLILGLLTPSAGRLLVLSQPPASARTRIGYMPQHPKMDYSFPVTVQDVVLMGRLGCGGGLGRYRRADHQAARRALGQVGLADLNDRPFHDLSGGQRQRVLIARALAGEPRLLLLDEPTANVDVRGEREVFELLKELNQSIAVVVVSHDLGFVSPYVQNVICVNRRVVSHPTSQVTGQVIADIYGGEVNMVRHDHQGCRHD
ncbi:putative metal transport system ATP-binding protein CPn_0542/CP_0210/CPj0542/CpB0563 [Desulfarculales bacterium]